MRLPTCVLDGHAPTPPTSSPTISGRYLMSRFTTTLLALSLLAPLTACETPEDGVQTRAVEDFEDGMACDSDQGAFRVTLWSDSGELEVGRNDLVIRLGFHDPSDPEAPGIGIPSARID